ncbi:hypothetical protein, partial [Pseudomonas sp. RA_35y_Pfl2_P32]
MGDETMDALEASFETQPVQSVVARPLLAGGGAASEAGFGAFLRSGASVEMKAFTAVSGDAGGY